MFRITRWGIKGHCDNTLMDKRTREPGRKHWVRERRLLFKQKKKNKLTCDICTRHVHKSSPFDRFRYKNNPWTEIKFIPTINRDFYSGGGAFYSHMELMYILSRGPAHFSLRAPLLSDGEETTSIVLFVKWLESETQQIDRSGRLKKE